MKIKITIIALLTAMFFSCSKKVQKADYQVIPLPKDIAMQSGTDFILNAEVAIAYSDNLKREAEFLSEYIKDFTGICCEVKKDAAKSGKTISLAIDKDISEHSEAYRIAVNANEISVVGTDAAGVFYGIQTLRKSLPVDSGQQEILLPPVSINDYPRFGYRGMHLDVSRHFFPIDSVKNYIDVMALHNINRFHLHLTDDQGWRMEIKKYPRLTEVGSKRAGTLVGRTDFCDTIPYGGFFTQDELRDLVEYAAERHITIVPEIDLPGHTLAVLASYPELGCTGGPYEVWQRWGVADDVVCPGNEQAMKFLEDVLAEVMDVFPSEYIHIGGDECPRTKWVECPKCQKKIKELGLKDDDRHKAEDYLQSYVMERMEKFVESNGRHIIGWDEILDGDLAPNATVMSWRGSEGGMKSAQMHHNAIMTPIGQMYFNMHQTEDTKDEPLAMNGYIPVKMVYDYEPIPEELSPEEAQYIIGVQANIWTEYIKDYWVVQYQMMPRVAALCEVQWCNSEQKDYASFLDRTFRLTDVYDHYKWKYATHVFDVDAKIQPNIKEKCINIELSKYGDGDIYYTLDSGDPKESGRKYTKPLHIKNSCDFKAVVKREKGFGKTFSSEIRLSKSSMKPITLERQPHKNYAFNGGQTLIDGLVGSSNYKTGRWIGFWGEPLDAIIDLERSEIITDVKFNVNVIMGDWMYNAKRVVVSGSEDGNNFREIISFDFPMAKKDGITNVGLKFQPVKARYVKVHAEPFDLPEGHLGYGYPAWLFVDEIQVF